MPFRVHFCGFKLILQLVLPISKHMIGYIIILPASYPGALNNYNTVHEVFRQARAKGLLGRVSSHHPLRPSLATTILHVY
jgi:hypothetical protein